MNEVNATKAKALALIAAGTTPKQAAIECQVTWNTVRAWQSQDRRAKAAAQGAGFQAAQQAIAASAGAVSQGGTSAGSSPAPPDENAKARRRALKLLEQKVREGDKEAAKALLAATRPRAGEGAERSEDAASIYKGLHDDELVERMLVCGVTQWGLARVRARLDELERAGQADAGGAHYPMPALLGGTEPTPSSGQAAPETLGEDG